MTKPRIGLLDCNNFFVSCERLFRPDLLGKPVLVLSSNDGCVVARSQEVKDIGVLMGVPYFQIKDIVKKHGITTFSSHFALYRDISRRVFSVMKEVCPQVEQYSIDEAFFTIDGDPTAVAKQLKERVEQVVGIPVSIGVAATKTQAKYASKLAKKGTGIQVLGAGEWEDMAARIPLQDIWGVGGKMELAFKAQGLKTVADLVSADQARIDQLFGVVGLRLQQELAGVSVHTIGSRSAVLQQSIMSSRSFKNPVSDLEIMADAVAYHTRHIAAELREMGQKARVLRVTIQPSRHGDFVLRGGVREVILEAPSNDTIELVSLANTALCELFEAGVPYKKAGVTVAGLTDAQVEQGSLFAVRGRVRAGAHVLSVLDTLNAAAGKEVVLVGSRLRSDVWQARTGLRSPAYTTKWADVREVKAQ